MKKFRNIIIFIAGTLLFILALGIWYTVTYSMDPVENRQVNSNKLEVKILIATQGSDFKRAVVSDIENQYKLDSVFLEIIDVSALTRVKAGEYKAIVILHTWEYGEPPSVVRDFIEQNSEYKDKLIVLATSGEGSNKIQGIDALSGESILENAGDFSDQIIEKINKLIK